MRFFTRNIKDYFFGFADILTVFMQRNIVWMWMGIAMTANLMALLS